MKKHQTRHGWTKLKKITETNCHLFLAMVGHEVSNFSFETKTWRWKTYEDEPCMALRKEGWLHTDVYHGNIELTHLNWTCCCTNWKDCQYHMPRLEHCSTQTEALTWLKLNFNFISIPCCRIMHICHNNTLFEL